MSQKRVLVVEDDEDNRRIFVYRLCKMRDFEVLEASDGQEVLEIAAREPLALSTSCVHGVGVPLLTH